MPDALESDSFKASPEVTLPVHFAGLVLSLDAFTLSRDSGDAIPLTRGEFALLRMFVARRGRVLSRDTLLDALANRRLEPFDRSVDVLVGRLRRKIETDPKQPCLIVTVPGEGYRFDGLTQTFDRKPLATVPESHDDRRLVGAGDATAGRCRADDEAVDERGGVQDAVGRVEDGEVERVRARGDR